METVMSQNTWHSSTDRWLFCTFVTLTLSDVKCISPPYLADDCRLVANARERRLRSTASRTCVVTRTYSTFGDRAFGAAGPGLWNCLPSHLKDADISYSEFRLLLKTFLFGQWGHGAVWTVLIAPTRFILTYLLTYFPCHRQVGVNESAAPVQEDTGGSCPQDWEEELSVGTVLRLESTRDRRADPHAEERKDDPQVHSPAAEAGAVRSRAANHEVDLASRVDHHAGLSVGRQSPRTVRGCLHHPLSFSLLLSEFMVVI